MVCGFSGAFCTCLADDLFDIKPVAEGVYAAIAKPAYKVNCNAAIILLDDSVLVVDTHSKPSAARGLIEQIKKMTDKPVKYVVNTHFHWDHYQGNQAYPSSWPAGVEIISSEATRQHRTARNPAGEARNRHHAPGHRKAESRPGKNQRCETERGNAEEISPQAEDYLAELQEHASDPAHADLRPQPDPAPQIAGSCRSFGWERRIPTATSLFICPKRRSLVTGDALHGWTPFMGDSYPYDWITTLDAAEKLDFDQVIGGHGDVMKGKQKFELWKQYFGELLSQTAQAYAEGATEEQAEKRVSQVLIARYADKFDPDFPHSVGSNVAKAYQVIAFMH